MTLNVYEQYFAADMVANGVPRHAALVMLIADSDAGNIRYEAAVTFFPHNDEEDFAISYDAYFSRVLYENKGRRSKKREQELLAELREHIDEMAKEVGGEVFWDQPLRETRGGMVQRTELIRTSQSWDGVELPNYLQGRPELVAMKYVFPAGQKLDWHQHPVMNLGILVQGELTIITQDGREKTVHEGEAVVEMVNTVHHGENRGSKPAVLYMFYLSQKDLPLSLQHPEMPLE